MGSEMCIRDRRTASTSTELGFSDHIAATEDPILSEIDYLLRRIPYQTGFSPVAFSDIHDFQILKKANVYIIEKMRIITLFTSAFNMNNKKLGRDTLANAERYSLIPHEQAGSRKFRRAIHSALEKVLAADMLRYRKWAG